jgi:hypothetical protein
MDAEGLVTEAQTIEQVGLYTSHRVALLALSILLLCVVLELVRRGHLKERYALLWLATAGAGLVLGVFPGLYIRLCELLRFQYITLLFALYFFFTLGLVLSFSIVISRLSERNRELTQEVALLSNAVKRLEKKVD